MSGINEFNSVQPEHFNSEMPDQKTGRKLLITAFLTAIIITGIAAVGFTMNIISKYKDDPYGMLIEQVASEIQLNEQQKLEVNKIKDEMNSKIGSKRIRKIKNAGEIEWLFRSQHFNKTKALEIANGQSRENREIAIFTVEELEKLHNLLTYQQRNDAVDKVKELYSKYKNVKK